MLVLARKLRERIVFIRRNSDGTLRPDSIAVITLAEIRGKLAKIAIDAPDDTLIFREEVFRSAYPDEARALPAPFERRS